MWGRSEALADLTAEGPPAPPPAIGAAGPVVAWRAVVLLPGRIRHGRLARMAVRTLAAAAVAVSAVILIPGTPSAPTVVTGCALW